MIRYTIIGYGHSYIKNGYIMDKSVPQWKEKSILQSIEQNVTFKKVDPSSFLIF